MNNSSKGVSKFLMSNVKSLFFFNEIEPFLKIIIRFIAGGLAFQFFGLEKRKGFTVCGFFPSRFRV